MSNDESIKNFAESVAFTAKGLFKTADVIKILYKNLLLVSIIFPVLALTFDMHSFIMKTMGVLSFLAALYILCNQDSEKKSKEYMELGSKVLSLYHKIENAYSKGEVLTDEMYEEYKGYIEETKELPIFLIAKKWVDKTIKKEMNLDWLES